MAPTKPLVRQQIDACYNIMAIPAEVTAEMTGTKITASRVNVWKDKRVFFITPHILQNDLDTIPDLGGKIRCVVVDEAHKALGKQANCEVIRKLQEVQENFRVLALSATPGSNFKNVTEVISNLLIANIECRTEESVDVAPYVFSRVLDTVVVPLGGILQHIKEEYLRILDHYTRPLINMHILSGNCAFLTKGKILLTMRDYKENQRNRNNYNQIMCNFTICITLYHGYELLIRHGLRSFLTFFENNIDKPLINSINNLRAIVSEVNDYLGPTPTVDILPDGTIPEIPQETKFGHPKFYKLADILTEHFQGSDTSTRVMVFCEYRESVNEAFMLLLKHRPLIRPKIFIGKGMGTGRGQTQAQQLLAIKMFREGKCNTLIATCIGEEGIDVGEVDLIVCFDISTKSPVRMVQRMGRTGRKRNGRVVILVTEGREQQTLHECLIQKSCMTNLLNSNHISSHFYNKNPRMIPEDLTPSCVKTFITVPKKNEKSKKNVQKNTLKNMFENLSSTQSSTKTDSEIEIRDMIVPEYNLLPSSFEFWSRTITNLLTSTENINSIYSKRLEKQTSYRTVDIGPSSTTNAFISLLKFSDKKKYNLPTTQTKTFARKEEPLTASQVNNFVQVDIRNMFKKPLLRNDDIEDIEPPLNDLITSINNYVKYIVDNDTCQICSSIFPCSNLFQMKPSLSLQNFSLPDRSIIDIVNEDVLKSYMSFLDANQNPSKSCSTLSETLEFFKLTDIEDIFASVDTEMSLKSPPNVVLESPSENKMLLKSPPKAISKSPLENKTLLKSPPEITPLKSPLNVHIDNISPVLFKSGRLSSLKSKLQEHLSQTKSCRKSFTFETNIKNGNDSETDLFGDEEEPIKSDNKINKSHVSFKDDGEIDMILNDLSNLENPTADLLPKPKPDNFLKDVFEKAKNVETMFDVGDISIFSSKSPSPVLNSGRAKSDYFDPDETILVSSDEEIAILSNSKLEKVDLTKLNNSPKKNNTFLSVTQLINIINDDTEEVKTLKKTVLLETKQKESTPKVSKGVSIFMDDFSSDFDLSFTTKSPVKVFGLKINNSEKKTLVKTKDEDTKPKPVEEKENQDWTNEESLLKLSYSSPWKNYSKDSSKESVLNPEIKKFVLSDSDDDFEERSFVKPVQKIIPKRNSEKPKRKNLLKLKRNEKVLFFKCTQRYSN